MEISGIKKHSLNKKAKSKMRLKNDFDAWILILPVVIPGIAAMMMPGQIRMVPNYISMLNFPFASQDSVVPGVSLLDTYWPFPEAYTRRRECRRRKGMIVYRYRLGNAVRNELT